MASVEVVNKLLDLVANGLTYLLPVIGIMAGLNWIFTFLMSVTMGAGKRTFRG